LPERLEVALLALRLAIMAGIVLQTSSSASGTASGLGSSRIGLCGFKNTWCSVLTVVG
jgi:hypothetical protein